jgi:hypothetical protein
LTLELSIKDPRKIAAIAVLIPKPKVSIETGYYKAEQKNKSIRIITVLEESSVNLQAEIQRRPLRCPHCPRSIPSTPLPVQDREAGTSGSLLPKATFPESRYSIC